MKDMVVGLDSGEQTLRTLLQHKESVEIPLYQRHYRWTDDKIETLWNDIIASLSEQSGRRTLFLGPTVFHNEESEGNGMSRYLVDGQQRITTLSLIIAYLFHELGEVELSAEENQQAGATRTQLMEMIFSTGDDPPQLDKIKKYEPRLKLAKRDRDAYRRYLREYEKTGRRTYLKMAMSQIEGLVDGEVRDRIREELGLSHDDEIPNEELISRRGPSLLELGTQLSTLFDKTAAFAVVEISDPFDPLTVFESLNSKGMPLAESDLIKNILIQRVSEGQKEAISDRWDDLTDSVDGQIVPFLRYWYISEYEFIRKKHLYASVKAKVNGESEVQRFLDQWEDAAEWYASIRNGTKPPEGDSELKSLIEKYSNLDFRQGIPILLAFASQGRINQMKESLPILNTMYIRLFVTASIRGSIVEKKLESICAEIRKSDKGLEKLKDEANRLIESYCPKINWTRLSVTNTKTQKFLLAEITRHQLKDPGKSLPPPARLQIEHILPKKRTEGTYADFDQIDHEHMVNYIGNLTLLIDGDNTRAGNENFEEKKKVYEEYHPDSPPASIPDSEDLVDKKIPMTADICGYSDWTKDSVHERGEYLGELADDIWTI